MTRAKTLTVLGASTLALVIAGAATPAAHALRADQYVTYNIYTESGDPGSPLKWTVTLHLQAISESEPTVVWDVSEVKIIEYDTNRDELGKWTDSTPSVDTADGYWHVTHTDADDPQPADFDTLPALTGTGAKSGSEPADLDYTIDGGATASSLAWAWSSFYFNFTLKGRSIPQDEREDEFVWVEVSNDPI